MTETKLNHYIQQFHLRKFCIKDSLFVYEKNRNKPPFQTGPRGIGAEKKLYPPELETFINKNYEQDVLPVFDKIINHEPLSFSDKEIMTQYIILSCQRVPPQKEYALNFVKQNEPKARRLIEDSINSLALNGSNKEELLSKSREYLSQVEKNGVSQPERVWYETIKKLDFPLLNDTILNRMKWHFIYNDNKDVFAMNDNPFCLTPPIGLKTRRLEILFPISKSIILWLNWSLYKNEYIQASEQFIKEANKRIVNTATKYIFFPTNERWLCKMVNKNKLDYKPAEFSGQLVKSPALKKVYESEIQQSFQQQVKNLKNHISDPIQRANENLRKLFNS